MKFCATPWPGTLAFLLALGAATSCRAATAAAEAASLGDTAQVAGHTLQLNGAGVGLRLMFRVYGIGLYLLQKTHRAEDVFASESPRRLTLVMLRDLDATDFADLVSDYLAAPGAPASPAAQTHLTRLAQALSDSSRGLKKNDVLTLDWVPGTGSVVALNGRPLVAPANDLACYNALLQVWLGDKPTDPALKTRLLGRLADRRG